MVNPNDKRSLYEVGGEYHCDLHIFRNTNMFPEWKNHMRFSVKDLSVNFMEDKSRGHQEDARRQAVLEFISFLNGEEIPLNSDIITHRRGTQLLYGVYKSAAKRFSEEDPLVNITF